MAASNHLPSYETLRQSGRFVRPSIDALRLHWHLFGSIEDSIKVLDEATDADSPQRPYQTPGSPGADGPRLRPVSAAAVTDPAVGSVTVTLQDLETWPGDWDDVHYHCGGDEEESPPDADGVSHRPRCCCG
jgi:hypothetical protein